MKDIFIPLDTMHQYMDQFTGFRKAAGIRWIKRIYLFFFYNLIS
jgi:hypothetical protein